MILPDRLSGLAEILAPEKALLRLTIPMSGNATSEQIAQIEALNLAPVLEALAWLYIDELERAHDICQNLNDKNGAAIHAIVHRREGDFWNSLYWWRQALPHPALVGQDPARLVHEVEANADANGLIEAQRAEWLALATACAS